MTPLRGIVPPLSTPLDAGGAVDGRSLERLVRRQLDDGVHGLFALGSSGEAIYLADADRRRVLEVVVGAASGAVPVLAGAVAGSTARVIEQVRWIATHRVDAIVVTAPFYANVSDAETVTHFERIAAASPVPLIAYDIPGNVGRKLPADVTIHLLRRGVIAGLKDTSGAMDDFVRILGSVPDRSVTTLMCGSDVGSADWVRAGADGIVPGIGNVAADLFTSLWGAVSAGDDAAVDRCAADISVVAGILGVGTRHGLGLHASQLGALKHTLVRQGVFATARVSPPLAPFPPAAGAEVDALMARVGR
jgi:4-hydroxy-tetrahydrodipicolinate synthase